METIHLFVNPFSGKKNEKDLTQHVKDSFLKHGFLEENITIVSPESASDAFKKAKEASSRGIDLVIPLGGDGTINKIIGGVHEGGQHTKIGLIPSGTVNNFAKSLSIPLDPDLAIDTILNGQDKKVDLCKVNDHYMISSLTLGLLADIAANVTTEDKRKFGPLAFLKDSFRILKRNRSYYLNLEDDSRQFAIKTKFLLVTMTNSIAGFPSFSPSATVNDGLLQVYTMKKVSFIKFLLHINDFRKGDFSMAEEITHFSTQKLTITPSKLKILILPRTRIDGDKSDMVPVTLTVLKEAVTVRVPNA
ncbi:diacylglycerol/lipid kinase family protein [Streptococcus porcinus]|uniref:Diacylglycerol kinase catalytic domain-containing protein n=1 Tax=Streptococcus porcinus TaxID=1340 RepID=A0A4V0H5I7_STRPO|nr:diacylglycerol kinase family protein [Streptococcus porcinus]VTT43605.1 diacylglycerol kinase catalytic domain-containing protein [Streptococcus porcinus]VTT45007.1 diacylglycerol kinase catalytic domain-containing protein [Streptococcus porcinus]